MRLRNIPEAAPAIESSIYVIKDPANHKNSWNKVFENNNPLHIEIGMGKGRFITELALLNPDINYIGIEMYSSVLYRALQKMDSMENPPKNLLFLNIDAKDLANYFAENEINKIYLNFSDPWPKDRHAKRRLESRNFLNIYEEILDINGDIEFKTDNIDLFNFALSELEDSNWDLLGHTFDLHNDPSMNEGNVMTEYEEKFSSKGNKICKYVIKRSSIH